MKRTLSLILVSTLFCGCALSAKKDILGDRISQEKVYTAINNYADLIKINKEKLQKRDTAENRINLANNYYHIKDYDSALYYIQPLLAKGRNSDAFLLKGKILEDQGQYNEALKLANKAISLNKKNAHAYNLVGVIYTKTKRFDEAKANFLRAKALYLPDETVNNNLGMLAISTAKFDDAVQFLLPLYNRGLKDPKIVNNLVLALVKSNQIQEANRIIERERLAKDPRVLINYLKRVKIK